MEWWVKKTLLGICSDNISAVETIHFEKGNQLANNLLEKYKSSEHILYNDLILMENMIRMHEESKPEFLAMHTDDSVEKVVLTTDKLTQQDLHEQAVTVLELLRDRKKGEMGEMEDSESFDEQQRPSLAHQQPTNNQQENIETNDLEKLILPSVQKYLKQGRIHRIYGEDGVCRSMHFFLSKDMTDIKCKHPKENFVKQKWIIQLHQVKEIKYGYDKNSPIAKSGSLFKKPPNPDKCFSVIGPILLEGPKNFHCVCSNSFEAKKWFDYLTMVFNEYKKTQVKSLKQGKSE